MSRAWILLVLSSILQIFWIVTLKRTEGFTKLFPVLLYLLVGISSTYCLSRALDRLPTGVCYAVYTGISLAGAALIEAASRGMAPLRIACIALILVGTAGLHLAERRPEPGPARTSHP